MLPSAPVGRDKHRKAAVSLFLGERPASARREDARGLADFDEVSVGVSHVATDLGPARRGRHRVAEPSQPLVRSAGDRHVAPGSVLARGAGDPVAVPAQRVPDRQLEDPDAEVGQRDARPLLAPTAGDTSGTGLRGTDREQGVLAAAIVPVEQIVGDVDGGPEQRAFAGRIEPPATGGLGPAHVSRSMRLSASSR